MVQLLYAIIIMSTSTIEFTTGKRGKENVISDGVRYSLVKKRTTAAGVVNSYWTCVTPGCTSRLVLHDGTISSTPSHKHDEQRAEITVHKANKVLKQSLRTPAREERRALLQPPIRAEQLWILSAWHSPSRLRTWTSQHHIIIAEVWPSAAVRGCYFHFKQALWRNFHRRASTLILNTKLLDHPNYCKLESP